MLYNIKKRTEGFTIIEVMIVLAIAGLIMLIVFLAVPALQRNSRNTSLKNDAGSILSAINDYSANNNGRTPTAGASSVTNGLVTINGAGGNAVYTNIRGGTTVNFSMTAPPATPAVGTINVGIGHKCTGAAGATTPNARSSAAVYATETGRNAVDVAYQCVDS